MGAGKNFLRIPEKFADVLQSQPETGMSFQVVTLARPSVNVRRPRIKT
jgi:hypothetical protein